MLKRRIGCTTVSLCTLLRYPSTLCSCACRSGLFVAEGLTLWSPQAIVWMLHVAIDSVVLPLRVDSVVSEGIDSVVAPSTPVQAT